MSQVIETVPFNFDDIYAELKDSFYDEGYDTAEGSNTSQLITAGTYLVSMLNVNTAVNINETILPYATKRDNVVNDARILSYEVQHPVSYVYRLTLRPIGTDTVVIPKYTQFTSGSYNYYYMGAQINIDPSTTKEFYVTVKEGTLYKYENNSNLIYSLGTILENGVNIVQYYVDIPYVNVEDDGIECYVSYYDTSGIYYDKEAWEESENTFIEQDEDTNAKQFVRIDNIEYETPRIYFRYAGVGYDLPEGTEVNLNILTTNGASGSMDISNPNGVSCTISNVECTAIELISAGSDEETTSNIQENAPKYYNSANRLVTKTDYIAACNRDNRVLDTCVWGGEDEFPKAPGHIWFTFLPNNTYTYSHDDYCTEFERDNCTYEWNYLATGDTLTDLETARDEYYNANYLPASSIRGNEYSSTGALMNPGVWDEIDDLRIPTLEFHNRHPIYCDFYYDIGILKFKTSQDQAVVQEGVFNVIYNAFNGIDDSVKYEAFDSEYFFQSIVKRIGDEVTDESGFRIKQTNKLVLNPKTVSLEQVNTNYRDIYIPLAAPYEDYYDDDGMLIISKLPSIDTENFVSYLGESGGDIYTDWSAIQADIDAGNKTKGHKVVVAPIRIRFNDKYYFSEHPGSNIATVCFPIYPDSVSQEDEEDYTFSNVKVYLRHEGQDPSDDDLLEYGDSTNGWTYEDAYPNQITLGSGINCNDETAYIEIASETFCGFYYLFNTYIKKEILIHLFVDASTNGVDYVADSDQYADLVQNQQSSAESSSGTGSSSSSSTQTDGYYLYSYDRDYLYTDDDFYLVSEASISQDTTYIETSGNTPRSYLYSDDAMYLYTTDTYYLTTNGYVTTEDSIETTYSGSVVREINTKMYTQSALKNDLFAQERYLNLSYISNDFQVIRNVIPRLRKVSFHDVI